jgi:hypothetical protein
LCGERGVLTANGRLWDRLRDLLLVAGDDAAVRETVAQFTRRSNGTEARLLDQDFGMNAKQGPK